MSIFNLIFFFSFLKEIITESINYDYFFDESTNEVNDTDILSLLNLMEHLNTLLLIINKTNASISAQCLKNLDDNYRNKYDKIEELYEGSSKGFVDMNSFLSCTNNTNNTFFSIYPNWTKEARMDIARLHKENLQQHLWIFGVCLKKDICSSEDIKLIFDSLNNLFEKPFKLYNKDNIIVDDYLKTKEQKMNTTYIFLNLIPFYLIFFQIIFMVFKVIPVKLFQCCLRRKYLRDIDNSKGEINMDNLLSNASFSRQIDLKIRKCFSISEIVDDILYSKRSELFKDEDMTYIKGIKTLGVILFIFGFSFTILYNYPLCLSEVEKRKSYMTDKRTIFLIISFRLAPALILSASGYSLSYKFLNFLDKKLTNYVLDNSEQSINNSEQGNTSINNSEASQINEDNTNKISEKMNKSNNTKGNSCSLESSSDASKSYYENTFGIKFYSEDASKNVLNKMFKGQRVNENVLLYETSTDKIPYSMYFNFIFRQWHKLVCLAIGLLAFRLSFPILLVIGGSPLIYYIYQTFFDKMSTSMTNYLYVGNFIDLYSGSDKFLMMQLFCIPMSEFNYFMIGSVLIFICYKKKLRLDIFIIILLIVSIAFKIVYVLTNLEDRNPGMFYTDSAYQRFFFNPIFNFSFYLIGMLFGMVNYIVQNGLTNKESLIKERPFGKIPLYLSKLCLYHQKGQKSNHYAHFIIIVLLLLFSLLIIPILFANNFENIIEKNSPDIFFITVSLIDIELFIYCFHIFSMSCYVSGQNIFFEILNANISSYGMKLSFWMVLGTPTLTYLVVYNNEANINLSFFMVLVYGSITLINTIVISLIFFLVMEMPYKKLVKLYFNISAELNKVYLEEESEENGGINDGDIGMNELNEKDLLEENGDENKNKDDNEDEFKD